MKSTSSILSFVIGAACVAGIGAGYLAVAGPVGGDDANIAGAAWSIANLNVPYRQYDQGSVVNRTGNDITDEIQFAISYGIANGEVRADIVPVAGCDPQGLRIDQIVSCPDGEHTYTFQATNGEIHLANIDAEQFVTIRNRTIGWDVKLLSADGTTLWGMAGSFDMH